MADPRDVDGTIPTRAFRSMSRKTASFMRFLNQIGGDRQPEAHVQSHETELRRAQDWRTEIQTLAKGIRGLVEVLDELGLMDLAWEAEFKGTATPTGAEAPSDLHDWFTSVNSAVSSLKGSVDQLEAFLRTDHPTLHALADAISENKYILENAIAAVAAAIITDHGGLSGLGDDDHPQYLLEAVLSAKGSLISASAAATPIDLAAGALNTLLASDISTPSGLKWATVAAMLATLLSTKGDLAVRGGGANVIRKGVGADNTLLVADSGDTSGVDWKTLAAELLTMLTTKGDLAVSTGATVQRLTVGADDTIPVADSAAASGLSYKTLGLALAALLTTPGDIAYRDGTVNVVRLPVGSNTQVLTVDTSLAGKLKWATPSGGGGGLTMTVVEVDLGSKARYGGSFTFTIPAATPGNPILIQQAYLAYTDKGDRADEAEMDVLSVIAVVGDVTTANAAWNCSPKSGPVAGNFKFAYAVSA